MGLPIMELNMSGGRFRRRCPRMKRVPRQSGFALGCHTQSIQERERERERERENTQSQQSTNKKREGMYAWIFKLGSTTKVECSSLGWAWYEPTNNVQAWARNKVEKLKLNLAWLDSLFKPSSSSISSPNSSSILCFWAWNPTQVYYQAYIKFII